MRPGGPSPDRRSKSTRGSVAGLGSIGWRPTRRQVLPKLIATKNRRWSRPAVDRRDRRRCTGLGSVAIAVGPAGRRAPTARYGRSWMQPVRVGVDRFIGVQRGTNRNRKVLYARTWAFFRAVWLIQLWYIQSSCAVHQASWSASTCSALLSAAVQFNERKQS